MAVVFNHIAQIVESSVVHVGSSVGHIAQARHLERTLKGHMGTVVQKSKMRTFSVSSIAEWPAAVKLVRHDRPNA